MTSFPERRPQVSASAVEALAMDRGSRSLWRQRGSGLLVLLGCALAASAMAQQSHDVSLRDGRLTIRANAAPAEQLAQALGEATGIAIVITGESTTPLSAEIIDEPVPRAIALLSPNHLLVRASADADADIIEVVLIMPDAQSGSGGNTTEFLPSGAPADDVVVEEPAVEFDADGTPIDPNVLREVDRGAAARVAAESQLVDPTSGEMTPEGAAAENVGGFQEPQIDPATGQPIATQ